MSFGFHLFNLSGAEFFLKTLFEVENLAVTEDIAPNTLRTAVIFVPARD